MNCKSIHDYQDTNVLNYFRYLLDGKGQPEAKSTAILFLHLLALKIVSTDFSDILS